MSSTALVGFGANSILDGAASAALIWRFAARRSRGAEADAVERRAALVVSVVMIGVALYVGATAISAVADHSVPERSLIGIVLTAASTLVLPFLARANLGLATQLRSGALRGDGVLSLAGAVLAAATLASLIVRAALGWWWADAVAALAIAVMLVGEGLRTGCRTADALRATTGESASRRAPGSRTSSLSLVHADTHCRAASSGRAVPDATPEHRSLAGEVRA